ncbi:hypothetical protein Sru01_18350 [Sphaerisporangium rufum]|uniref:Uncharacterized protein n=1 Tax=Sphaerisporangium rufum TaxID=1381558 RepID=A0A919R0R4_9ACTN|nr:hypothetical protein [Sphaerisporangium rufum]GII76853.1 hypothetical protein Sru01_18350 [Sphaerisporangium rufum]
MAFVMRLPPPAGSAVTSTADLPQDIGEFEALIMDATELLAASGCEFLVAGFGQARWPVTVDYDLAAVLLQVPQVLSEVRAGLVTALDFYAQGTARLVEIVPNGETVRLCCRSATSWTPEPEVEYMGRHELDEMLVSLARDFVTALRTVAPQIAIRSPFQMWASGRL